ncbi:uncharacterized protein LOC132752552, partial [Ruditapes philippinarum]|uniref:uncharacterized protein LOC132752552 n=1 Tax=Ruditapes philippinarum TaxID=129788 RepID=UPI00295A7B72
MPSESEPKTLSDDFINRVTNTFRPEFIKNVDNPSLLADFLTCLEVVDREVVKAQHTQYGAIHAAGILFDRVIKRPDWIDNLTSALRHPQIGLDFLAESMTRFEGTIPARWDLTSFTDPFGRACFNGNCSDIKIENLKVHDLESDQVGVQGMVDIAVQETNSPHKREVVAIQETSPSAGIETPGVPNINSQHLMDASLGSAERNYSSSQENKQSLDEVDASGNAQGPMEVQETEINSVSRDEMIKKKEKEIELKREELRLKMMEKIYSFIDIPADVPVALHYLKEVNIQIGGILQGSVIFSIYIGSLDALQQFEKLWRYGGL